MTGGVHETCKGVIEFTMKEIWYLMNGKIPEKKAGFITLPAKPQLERFYWQENVVSLCLVPPVWAGANRLTDYVRRMGEAAQKLWIAPELEPYFPGWKQPFPEPELAAFLFLQQPFRENLVILRSKDGHCAESENDGTGGERHWDALWPGNVQWLERFLENCFDDLNGLYLVGGEDTAETEEFLDWIYEQSGLAVCRTNCMPDTDGRRTAVVDLCRSTMAPVRKLAAGSLYLDLTSCMEKQRILKEKRTDISYISARNYLDTAFKARYNVF